MSDEFEGLSREEVVQLLVQWRRVAHERRQIIHNMDYKLQQLGHNFDFSAPDAPPLTAIIGSKGDK